MKHWSFWAVCAAAAAGGCGGPAPEPSLAGAPAGSEVIERGGQKVVVEQAVSPDQVKEFRLPVEKDDKKGTDPAAAMIPAADLAKDPDAYQGTLVEVPTGRERAPNEAPPITQAQADKLGGYRLKIEADGRCRLHITGIDLVGQCVQQGPALVVKPETVAGKPLAEAAADPALKGMAKEMVLTAAGEDRFRLKLAEDKEVLFAKGR